MSVLDSAIQMLSGRTGRFIGRPLMTGRASIFMLHRLRQPTLGIGGHSAEFVREAIDVLRGSGAELVSVQQIIASYRNGSGPGPNWVAFTMDDGFADQAELIEQAFLPKQCPVTVFLITGLIDGQLWPWDDQLAYLFRHTSHERLHLSHRQRDFDFLLDGDSARGKALNEVRNYCKTIPNVDIYDSVARFAESAGVALPRAAPPEFRPMSWDRIRTLAARGVDFAPHSVTHRIFAQLSDDEARSEILQSTLRLKEELGTAAAPLFAWPTGELPHFSRRDELLAHEAGMVGTLATASNYAYVGAQAMQGSVLPSLYRFGLPGTIRDVLQYGSWIERGKQIVRRVGAPLCLTAHGLASLGSRMDGSLT